MICPLAPLRPCLEEEAARVPQDLGELLLGGTYSSDLVLDL